MPLPQATIRYVHNGDHEARKASELTVDAPDSLELVRTVMQACRELRSQGASVLWTDFVTDGITRRRYVDGRVGRLRLSRP